MSHAVAALLQHPPHLSRLPTAASSRHLALLDAVRHNSLADHQSLIVLIEQDLRDATLTCTKRVSVAAYPLLLILMGTESVKDVKLDAVSNLIHHIRPLMDSVQSCLNKTAEFELCRLLLRNVIESLSSAAAGYLSSNTSVARASLSPAISILSAWESHLGVQHGATHGLVSLVLGSLLKSSGALDDERSHRDKFNSSLRLLEDLECLAATYCPLALTVLTKILLRGSVRVGRLSAEHVYKVYLGWLDAFYKKHTPLPEDTKKFLNASFEMMIMASPEAGLRPLNQSAYDSFVLEAYETYNFWSEDVLSKCWSSEHQVKLLCMYFRCTDHCLRTIGSQFHHAISFMAIKQIKQVPNMCIPHNVRTSSDVHVFYQIFLAGFLTYLAQVKSSPRLELNLLPYLIEFGVINQKSPSTSHVDLLESLKLALSEQRSSLTLLDRILLAFLPESPHEDVATALTKCCARLGLARQLCEQLAQRYNSDVSTSDQQKTLHFTVKSLHSLAGIEGADSVALLLDHNMSMTWSGHAHLLPEKILLACVYINVLPPEAGREVFGQLLPTILDALRSDEISQTLVDALMILASQRWCCERYMLTMSYWELVVDYVKRCAECDRRRHLARLIQNPMLSDAIPAPALCGLGRYVCSLIREEESTDFELLKVLRAILCRVNAIMPLTDHELKESHDEDLGPFVPERRLADLSLAVTQALAMTHSGETQTVELSLECVLQALLIHTRCPRSLYSRVKQAWAGISAGVKYPTATYHTVSQCLQILQRCCFAFAADFTYSMIRNEFLPDVLNFLRSCQSSEVKSEGRIKRLASQLFDLLHSIGRASGTCEKELAQILSPRELEELQQRWNEPQIAIDGLMLASPV